MVLVEPGKALVQILLQNWSRKSIVIFAQRARMLCCGCFFSMGLNGDLWNSSITISLVHRSILSALTNLLELSVGVTCNIQR